MPDKPRLSESRINLLEKIDGWKEFAIVSRSEIVADNKKTIFDLAKGGAVRPTKGKHPLAGAFNEYISPKSSSYDQAFTLEIQTLRPDWFPSIMVSQKKQQLLQLATDGGDKPPRGSMLYNCLKKYMNPNSDVYDPEFKSQILLARPDWFVGRKDGSNRKKQELLKLAAEKSGKPSQRTVLGNAFCRYTNPNNGCYDNVFVKKIQKLAPDWLLTITERVDENKKELLKAAISGSKKPKHLSNRLSFYTTKNSGCYDRKFDKQIRKLRPDWFMTNKAKAGQKKLEILKLASSGSKKPLQSHYLGNVLNKYTNKNSGCYDPKFDKQIRKLRPDWFKAC